MNIESESEALAALGHPGRLAVFRLLARRVPQGARPSDVADALGLRPNTLSVYVSTLTRAGLLTTWRDGRSVYYSLNLERFGGLVSYLVNDCCRGRPELCFDVAPKRSRPAGAPYDVLFVCTGNSARSIFAEALLGQISADRFIAHSAGTDPYPNINPRAAQLLQAAGHDVARFTPKPIDRFFGTSSKKMDFIFTVCDRAVNEDTPPWPGGPMIAHWGVPDPVGAGNDNGKEPFEAAYRMLERKVARFATLPLDALAPADMQRALDDIGRSDSGGVSRPPEKPMRQVSE